MSVALFLVDEIKSGGMIARSDQVSTVLVDKLNGTGEQTVWKAFSLPKSWKRIGPIDQQIL